MEKFILALLIHNPPLRALPHIVLDNEKKIIIQIVITKAAILYSHKRPILRIFEYLKQGKIGHLHINQICISYKLDAFSFLLNYDAEQDKLSSKKKFFVKYSKSGRLCLAKN